MGQPADISFPPSLFKYRSLSGLNLEWTRQLIVEGKIWFSSPLDFNDPFDTLPHVRIDGDFKQIRAHCRRIIRDNRSDLSRSERLKLANAMATKPRLQLEAELKKAMLQTVREVAVCSFAIRFDDVLMWSHYADHHRGICVRLNTACDYFRRSLPFPVRYQADRPSIDWTSSLEPTALLESMLTKAEFWDREREWRQFEKTAGVRIMPPGVVDGVYIGCRVKEELRETVLGWIDRVPASIEVFAAKPSARAFGLEFEKIR